MPRLRTYKYVITHADTESRKILINGMGDPVVFDNIERARDYIRAIETYPATAHGLKHMRAERAHKWRVEIAAAMVRGQ